MSTAERLQRWRRVCYGLLLLGLIGSVAGVSVNQSQFFMSYLFGYMFCFSIAMGSLIILMIYFIVGGQWGQLIKPVVGSAAMTFPWLAFLFIPLLFGLSHLYPWARPDVVAHDPILQHKHAYLNVGFFIGRAVFFFFLWSRMAYHLARWPAVPPPVGEPDPASLARRRSARGLVFVGLTITFAMADWMMSLEPHWYSTVYEAMLVMGMILGAFAFALCCLRWSGGVNLPTKALLDNGNLMLAFIMMWAYTEFSQYIIIWSGNLPEEISWYLHRQAGGWFVVALLVIFCQFVFPFLALLGRGVKMRIQSLYWVALLILLIRIIDMFWLTVPAFYPHGFHLSWQNILVPLAIVGAWTLCFLRELARRPAPIGEVVA